MTTSILGLKHSQACCNIALSMPTNAASIAVLNDAILGLVCVSFNAPYIFQRSTLHTSKRFNSGLLGGQNGSRGEQLGLSW